MKILCILTNNFEDLEAIGTIALLRRANLVVDIYSLNSNNAKGKYGTYLQDLKELKDLNLDEYNSLFIAGGPQYVELSNSQKFLDIITYFYKNNLLISAICAGPTILGKLGYLKDTKYTCFTSMNEDFGGIFIDVPCLSDKNIITGRSAASVIDFAFLIIEKLQGKEIANSVKERIYYNNK